MIEALIVTTIAATTCAIIAVVTVILLVRANNSMAESLVKSAEQDRALMLDVLDRMRHMINQGMSHDQVRLTDKKLDVAKQRALTEEAQANAEIAKARVIATNNQNGSARFGTKGHTRHTMDPIESTDVD